MLTCLALVLAVGAAELPSLAAEVEAEARSLTAQTEITPAFLADAPTVDALTARHDLTPARYAAFAMAWVAQGATIVGGCCEVGPAHIAALATALRAAGHQIA